MDLLACIDLIEKVELTEDLISWAQCHHISL
jgi:hypothetical protein